MIKYLEFLDRAQVMLSISRDKEVADHWFNEVTRFKRLLSVLRAMEEA